MAGATDSKFYLKLSATERIELIAEIWASLHDNGQVVSPAPEVVAEARRRIEEIRANPGMALSWQELCRRRGWPA